jgi:hypothetical protein
VSALEAFGLIGGLASIVAIPLAFIVARKYAQRTKLLAFESHVSPVPLVSTRSLRDYKLFVVFQQGEDDEERIAGAYLHFLQFANFGADPIRREDIATGRGLELEVRGTRLLDIAVEAVHRPVSNITIDPDIQLDEELATARVDFDFLDRNDGALVRFLTTSRPTSIALVGDIVGMPDGIQRASEIGRRPLLGWVGAILAVALQAAALALTPFVFYWVTGSWSEVWLLALPIVAVVLPIVIIVVVNQTIWPKGGVNFPHDLMPSIRGIPFPIYFDHPAADARRELIGSYSYTVDDDELEDEEVLHS